jgi:uncharacterized pyridoxamine 5'-phosphate oxidase family protein
MTTAVEYLKANRVFHLATADGGKGRVRPFGFVMVRDNKMYFCTNDTKDVYKQMIQNPDIEVSAMGADETWLRVRGKVALDKSRDAKAQAFAEAPFLLTLYPKGAEDESFALFYFTEAQAMLYSFTGAPQNLPLI